MSRTGQVKFGFQISERRKVKKRLKKNTTLYKRQVRSSGSLTSLEESFPDHLRSTYAC